jgi:hypothetical protein
MAASIELNTILRDAAKWPLLRMTLNVVPDDHVDDTRYAGMTALPPKRRWSA